MKTEIISDKELLKNYISENYGINVERMKHLPIGEVAHSYIMSSTDQRKFFLKIYPPSRLVTKNIDTLEASHHIAHSLYHHEGIDQITYPLQTKTGEYKSIFEDSFLVVWSFIEGHMATEKQRKQDGFLEGLANLLGRIHNSTSNLNLDKVAKFNFDLKFRRDLLLSIKEATACTDSKDKNYNKLQKLIKKHMSTILETLVYLEGLSQKLKEQEKTDFVICHSDPIIHNIIVGEDKKLHLVDWDGATLAPFEQDIWFYLCDDKYELFVKKYKETRNIEKLNEDIVVFLFYERTLADLTDWIYRILFEETTRAQIKSDFKGLEEDSWPVLTNIKETEIALRNRVMKLLEQ